MRITEIFFSIQGESTHAGKPCVFVRLTGCSLRCLYCDTKYAYAGGREMSLQEVLGVVAGYPAKLRGRRNPVLFSPAHDDLPARNLARWILDDGLPVRLQLQIHKYIWGADARGV